MSEPNNQSRDCILKFFVDKIWTSIFDNFNNTHSQITILYSKIY